jgi:hypothetical protein
MGHLGYFQSLGIVTSAAINMGLHILGTSSSITIKWERETNDLRYSFYDKIEYAKLLTCYT